MARKVYQVRYYGDSEATTNGKNQPTNLTGNRLRSGSVFSQYTPIKQIGIQSMPGVKFYLNNSIEPITIGSTGIYELDMADGIEVFTLQINSASLAQISSSADGYIIIDVLYDDRKGGSV